VLMTGHPQNNHTSSAIQAIKLHRGAKTAHLVKGQSYGLDDGNIDIAFPAGTNYSALLQDSQTARV